MKKTDNKQIKRARRLLEEAKPLLEQLGKLQFDGPACFGKAVRETALHCGDACCAARTYLHVR